VLRAPGFDLRVISILRAKYSRIEGKKQQSNFCTTVRREDDLHFIRHIKPDRSSEDGFGDHLRAISRDYCLLKKNRHPTKATQRLS